MKPTNGQRVLFCGLDCEPGQQDLFDTDGPAEQPKRKRFEVYQADSAYWFHWEPYECAGISFEDCGPYRTKAEAQAAATSLRRSERLSASEVTTD